MDIGIVSSISTIDLVTFLNQVPILLGNETLAQLQVHPMAIETTAFGIDFMIRPQTPLQALSTSLEVGKMVTIQIANDKMRIFCHRKHIYYTSGEILFLSTDHLGQHEVACMYQS